LERLPPERLVALFYHVRWSLLTASPENALHPPSLSPLGPWLDEFLTDKVRLQLHETERSTGP